MWLYWEQGLAAAPETVHLCVRSWRERNPGWAVRVLDSASVGAELAPTDIDLHRPDLTVQKRANFIRLLLLTRHGGVWADATTYCWEPLDDWLPEAARAGFFAFRNPGPDRLLSNWFLAAEASSELLARLLECYSDVFRGRVFDRQSHGPTRDVMATLRRYYSRDPQGTVFWTTPWALDYLRAYPYFIFHYAFNALVLQDASCARRWDEVPPRPAGPAHLLKRSEAEDPQQVLRAVYAAPAPVQKLTWRADAASPYWSVVLAHLTSRLDASA